MRNMKEGKRVERPAAMELAVELEPGARDGKELQVDLSARNWKKGSLMFASTARIGELHHSYAWI